eukprot:1618826-Pyramimonas_sp.AAC.1
MSVTMSPVAALQLELNTENGEFLSDDSNSTNRFGDLARLADQVQTSRFNRRTCLMILSAIAVLTSTLADLQLELRRETRQRVSS